MVDAQVHAWEGALRGVSPDSGFYDYMALTHGMLGPLMTLDDVAIGQRVTALRALEHGVTTIIDNCHNARSSRAPRPTSRCSPSTGFARSRRT